MIFALKHFYEFGGVTPAPVSYAYADGSNDVV